MNEEPLKPPPALFTPDMNNLSPAQLMQMAAFKHNYPMHPNAPMNLQQLVKVGWVIFISKTSKCSQGWLAHVRKFLKKCLTHTARP